MVTTKDTQFRGRKAGRINRGDKAQFLFERGHVHSDGNGWTYRVHSETDESKSYHVGRYTGASGHHWECKCEDYRKHALSQGDIFHTCKHIQAVFLYRQACRSGFKGAAA